MTHDEKFYYEHLCNRLGLEPYSYDGKTPLWCVYDLIIEVLDKVEEANA